jgi:hypothetical protein
VYSLLAGQTKRARIHAQAWLFSLGRARASVLQKKDRPIAQAKKELHACPSFTGTAAVAQTRLFEKVKFEY